MCSTAAMMAHLRWDRRMFCRSPMPRTAIGGPMKAPTSTPARCRPISTGSLVSSNSCGATPRMASSSFEAQAAVRGMACSCGSGGDDRSALVKRQVEPERGSQLLGRHGSGQQKALQEIATQFGKQFAMFQGFDALDRHKKPACFHKRNNAAKEFAPLVITRQKTPLDLHVVAAEMLEIFQVGISRAKIVQPQSDAHGAKRRQARGHLLRAVDDRTFGEFEHEPGRRKPGFPEDTRHGRNQRRVAQIEWREDDADWKRWLPPRRLLARTGQHPFRQRS